MSLITRRSPKLAIGQAPQAVRDALDTLEDRPKLPRKTPLSTDDGYLGEICADDNYLYIRGTSAWKRIALNAY